MYTDNYSYAPIFKSSKKFKAWFMDSTFNFNIKKGLYNNLVNKRKVYKMYASTFNKLLRK